MGDSLFSNETRVEVFHETLHMQHDAFKQLHRFQQQGTLCDVIINVHNDNRTNEDDGDDGTGSGCSVKCHRVILACYSDYFRAMFSCDMKESKVGVVKLHDVDGTAIRTLIEFCYTHTITLSVDNVQSLLHAASVLQMQTVVDYCSSFIRHHINSSNCLNVREFGILHGQMGLVKIAESFMKRNFIEVSATNDFKLITFQQLLQLIKSPDLIVDSEKQVYDSVMKWIKHNIDERKVFLSELLDNVRLPMLSVDELVGCIENEEFLRSNIHCRDLIDEAKTYQLSLITRMDPSKMYVSLTERTQPRLSYSGFLMIAGGRNKHGEPISSVECYDVATDSWFYVSDMTTSRRHVGLASLGDEIYAAGGFANNSHLSSVECYDVKTNTWSIIPSLSKPRRGLGLVSYGGTMYTAGGLTDGVCYNTVERYDASARMWACVATMIIPRGGIAMGVLHNEIYAVGGNDGMTSVSSCEKYNPLMDKWTKIASLSNRRAGAGLASLNGSLYAIGGFDGELVLSSVERYDSKRNKWLPAPSLLSKRGGVGVAVMAGKIYAAGGHDGKNFLNTVEVFSPEIEEWSVLGSLNCCRAGAGLAWCSSSVIRLKNLLV